MPEFQSTLTASPDNSVWGEPKPSRAQEDMEALRRSAQRLAGGVLLLAFAATAAAYVWRAWLN